MNFIQYLIEAKLAQGNQTWLDILIDDARVTLNSTGYDPVIIKQMVEWAKTNRKTLNHMYIALKDNYRTIAANEVDPEAEVDVKLDHWMSRMDYRDLPIYNELAKRHDKDDVSHVARMMIDTIVDEIRDEG